MGHVSATRRWQTSIVELSSDGEVKCRRLDT